MRVSSCVRALAATLLASVLVGCASDRIATPVDPLPAEQRASVLDRWETALADPAVSARHPEDVTLGELSRDIERKQLDGRRAVITLLMPPEYWRVALLSSGLEASQVSEMIELLSPYLMAAVARMRVDALGGLQASSEAAVRSVLRLRLADGRRRAPLLSADLPDGLDALAAGMKPSLARTMGSLGEALHLFFFEALDSDGVPIGDPFHEGLIRIDVDDVGFDFYLPFESLLEPGTCPVDDREMAGSWRVCPWHGAALIPGGESVVTEGGVELRRRSEVNPGELVQELQHGVVGDGEFAMVTWLSTEYWLSSMTLREDLLPEVEKALDPYILIAAAWADVGPMGAMEFRSEAEVRDKFALLDADGESVHPLGPYQVSADVDALLAALAPMFRSQSGQVGEGTHFLAFERRDVLGEGELDILSSRVLRGRLGSLDLSWRLPVEALLEPKVCPADGRALPGSWSVCPWHGEPLGFSSTGP